MGPWGERGDAEAVGRGDAGVSFDVTENGTVALVGESGSGKSVTAMSILNLLPENAERPAGDDPAGAATCCRHAGRAAGLRGKGHRLRLPGPDDQPEPGVHVGLQWSSRCAAPGPERPPGDGAPRSCWPRWACPSRSVAGGSSARDVRRPAAARDDRDGAGLRAQAADRRRADHRAGRDHPAPDPRAAREAEGGTA